MDMVLFQAPYFMFRLLFQKEVLETEVLNQKNSKQIRFFDAFLLIEVKSSGAQHSHVLQLILSIQYYLTSEHLLWHGYTAILM